MANIKEPENKKDFIIRVRVTPAERDEFLKRAKAQGYRTVSEFIRSLVSEKPEQNGSTWNCSV